MASKWFIFKMITNLTPGLCCMALSKPILTLGSPTSPASLLRLREESRLIKPRLEPRLKMRNTQLRWGTKMEIGAEGLREKNQLSSKIKRTKTPTLARTTETVWWLKIITLSTQVQRSNKTALLCLGQVQLSAITLPTATAMKIPRRTIDNRSQNSNPLLETIELNFTNKLMN